MTEQNAQLEGDDFDERPLRIVLFGSQFCAVDDASIMASASGPNCLQTMALRLLQSGFDPDRPLILFRANQNIGRTTIAAAAQQENT
jgi:hypothetical protein